MTMCVQWYVLAAKSREGTNNHTDGGDCVSQPPLLPPTISILFCVAREEDIWDKEEDNNQHRRKNETTAQYYNYVERLLELLDRGGFNPLLLTSEGSDTEHEL